MTPVELVHIGDIKVDTPRLSIIEFGPDHCRETVLTAIPAVWPEAGPENIVWINLHGLHDTTLLATVGAHYGLHPLVLEDILNTNQRPKSEDYPDFVFIVMKLVELGEAHRLSFEHVSLVLNRHVVLTFQERPSGTFSQIRDQLRNARSQIARLGPDHLTYLLLDAITDRYFLALEFLSETAERLENKLMFNAEPGVLRQIQSIKRQAAVLRRQVWPLRDVMYQLSHRETEFIDPETRLYLRDVHDHVLHVLEVLDLLRDQIAGLMDMYMSALSNRLNHQMRILTVITTIFMPLTLIAGIYGMNFEFMPELKFKGAYFIVLAAMLGLSLGMLGWFRRHKWI